LLVSLSTVSLLACLDQSTVEPILPDTESAPVATVVGSKFSATPGGIENEYIVMLKGTPHARMAPAQRLEIDATIDRLAVMHHATIERRYTTALRGFAARMPEADARALAEHPDVELVEQNALVHASTVQTEATFGIDRIDQRSLPLDSRYDYASDGAGVTVFVVDSGIRSTHVEFTGRINLGLGGTVIDDGLGSEDCDGHGTHVAGTIAGTVLGVAKKATVVPIRVLDCEGDGSYSGIVAAIDHVAANHPPKSVANLSLGGPASAAMDTSIRNLVASGVTVVVAAGNENQDACTFSPGREPTAITVASSTKTDARSSFSNYGSCVDLFAPGSEITSAGIASDTAVATFNGTSMASPHVAGAAALFIAQNPSATPAQVTAALLASATPSKVTDLVGSPNLLLYTTFTTAPAEPTTGQVTITSPASGSEVSSTFVVTVDAAGAQMVALSFDGVTLVTDNAAPFAFEISSAPAGVHALEATAAFAGGTNTDGVTVTVKSVGVGNNPLPPPPPVNRPEEGGCAAGGHGTGGSFGALLIATFAAMRRRNRRARREVTRAT
jgi:uncharacterized protein (TIGR03382 family)